MDVGTLTKSIAHYKKCHQSKGYIKCCRLKFRKECEIEDHIKLHCRPDMFQCVNSIFWMGEYKIYCFVNKTYKCPFRCPFEECRRILRTRLSLFVHVSDHRSQNRFECDICGKICSRLSKMKRHMSQVHSKVSCNICLKKSVLLIEMANHRSYGSID